jgi:hypothetical protein
MAIAAERRLEKVEAALGPTELVARWLTEAHAFDDITSYVRWLLDQPPSLFPLDRLVAEANASVRGSAKGRASDATEQAVRKAIRVVIFGFELVMRINVVTHESLDREELVHLVLGQQLALTSGCNSLRRSPEAGGPGRVRVQSMIVDRVSELAAMETARVRVEARHLGGSPALFPADHRRWTEQRQTSEKLAVMAAVLADLDGVELPPPPAEPEDARVETLIDDLVEPARATTLDKMGDGHGAHSIAVRWVASSLSPMADRR